MKKFRLPRATILGSIVAALLLITTTAWGHVGLDAPNGGEVLEVGSSFVVTWRVLISHPALNWDLWYSTTGSTGPWLPIEMDVPPGDTSVGSVHTYDWEVPDAVSATVRVRVRMDNPGTDYQDVSDDDLRELAQWCKVNGWKELQVDDRLLTNRIALEYWKRIFIAGLVKSATLQKYEDQEMQRLMKAQYIEEKQDAS